jgi:hypothetical protein
MIRPVVEVRATEATIEVSHRGTRIASHARSGVKRRRTMRNERLPRRNLGRNAAYTNTASPFWSVTIASPSIDPVGLHTTCPALGSRRMTALLRADGLAINRKRVQRLMRKMGIAALGSRRAEEALSRFGRPEIFNIDQGSQFTRGSATAAR